MSDLVMSIVLSVSEDLRVEVEETLPRYLHDLDLAISAFKSLHDRIKWKVRTHPTAFSYLSRFNCVCFCFSPLHFLPCVLCGQYAKLEGQGKPEGATIVAVDDLANAQVTSSGNQWMNERSYDLPHPLLLP